MRFHKISFVIALVLCCAFCGSEVNFCFADTDDSSNLSIYLVYDELNNVLFESNFVEVGDIFISREFRQYEVYEVDEKNLAARAEETGRYIKPKVVVEDYNRLRFATNLKKSVGIYMTHNDESFVPTDGVSSVYGAGGIHDVAGALAQSFFETGYDVYFDETLHIPHDSGAYTRSLTTAKRLLENKVDALFDVHRDGVSRSVYVKLIDGVERCKVRIVIGQANANSDANLQFAMYLMTVAEEYCPWLFLDIYFAKGHYNQALSSKALLFEMGTYLAEKELVLASVPKLAEVVDKTLFSTIVQEDNSLIVKENVTESEQENLVTNVLESYNIENNFQNKYMGNVTIFIVILLVILAFVAASAIRRINKNKREKYSLKKP